MPYYDDDQESNYSDDGRAWYRPVAHHHHQSPAARVPVPQLALRKPPQPGGSAARSAAPLPPANQTTESTFGDWSTTWSGFLSLIGLDGGEAQPQAKHMQRAQSLPSFQPAAPPWAVMSQQGYVGGAAYPAPNGMHCMPAGAAHNPYQQHYPAATAMPPMGTMRPNGLNGLSNKAAAPAAAPRRQNPRECRSCDGQLGSICEDPEEEQGGKRYNAPEGAVHVNGPTNMTQLRRA
eukprot:TRINITY_DN11787_c0_g1_i1.p1 TRINITY_DN11787_c0_g1~~TRINITY_DN11787_c0_g1_i1.p1  ORF type:complete len:234 (+),score=32.72 TRINITY_DN11787_c0_g1_i1:72-773(+)